MTRFAGYSYRGTHPGLKSKEDPLSDSYITNSVADGGIYGLLIAGAIALRPASRPFFLANSCKWASRLTVGILPLSFYWPRWQRSILESNGEKVPQKKQPWVKDLAKWGEDDLAVAGMVFGMMFLTHPVVRMYTSGLPTWQRVLGLASISSGITVNGIGSVVPEIRKANERETQRMKQSLIWWAENRQSIQILGKTFTLSAAIKTESTNGTQPKPRNGVQAASSNDEGISLMLPGNGPEVRSVQKPHKALVRPDGSETLVPMTDYDWHAATQEETIKVLEQHVKDLSELRKEQADVANTLWLRLVEKEHQYYTEMDPRVKESLKKGLESLGSIHFMAYAKMTEYSWMIADATKNIRQAQALGTLPFDESGIAQKRQHLAALQDNIKIGTFGTTLARLEAAEASLKWLREQIKRNEADYRAFAMNAIAMARQQLVLQGQADPGDVYEKPEPVLKNLLEIFSKDNPDLPQVAALRDLRQLEAEGNKELGRLREEHWSTSGSNS